MKVVTSSEMQRIDKETIEGYGVPSVVLMENAGLGVVEVIKEAYSKVNEMGVAVFAGCGNNGGDGLVIARHLSNQGVDVRVFLVGKASQVSHDCGVNLRIARKMKIPISEIASKISLDRVRQEWEGSRLVIDAIFGTGLSRDVSGVPAAVIEFINSLKVPIISVDIPSGLSADTAKPLGIAVKATETVTFGLPKRGLILFPGVLYAGKVTLVDIGIPRSLLQDPSLKTNILMEEEVTSLLPIHLPDAHKGDCGRVVVLAGSVGMTGAAALVSEAALKIGAGLVTLGIPEGLNRVMEVKLTEVMTRPLPETLGGSLALSGYDKIKEMLLDADVLAIGPGLGREKETSELVWRIIEEMKIPMVIDADGINALSLKPEVLKKSRTGIVLTPHPGEAARFLGIKIAQVQEDRIETARSIAQDYHTICVLKGARTIIASPEEVFINSTGNVGMASGGVGDVLCGMIAGLLAQGLSCFDAAKLGVYLHGLAADLLIEEIDPATLIASDIIGEMSKALKRAKEVRIRENSWVQRKITF